MSWYVYDSQGYVGDLATNRGLVEMSQHIQRHGEDKLKALIESGHTRVGPVLSQALDALPPAAARDVNDTIDNLKKLVAKCADIVIITDGTGMEE